MAWATCLASNLAATDRPESSLDTLREVERRAAQTLEWVSGKLGLVDEALDQLTLGRVALYRAILKDSSFEPACEVITAAVDHLRAASDMIYFSLLSRAWLRYMEGDPEGAQADLDESWYIAERGSMKLHMADIHLHRVRLFRDHAALDAAAKLIEETGYHRRDGELADAREALGSGSASSRSLTWR